MNKKILFSILICALFFIVYLLAPKQSFAATCRSGEYICGASASICCSNSLCTQGCYDPNQSWDCRTGGCVGDPMCQTGYTGSFTCNQATGKCQTVCPNDQSYCEAGVTSCKPNLIDYDGNPVPQCGTGGTCVLDASKPDGGVCQTCDASYSCNKPDFTPSCSASGTIGATVSTDYKKLRFRVYNTSNTANSIKCDSKGGAFYKVSDTDRRPYWNAQGCGSLTPNFKWSNTNIYAPNTFSSTNISRNPYLVQVRFGSPGTGIPTDPIFGGICKYYVNCSGATPTLTKTLDDCETVIGTVVNGKTVNTRVLPNVTATCGTNANEVGVSFTTKSTATTNTTYYPMLDLFYPEVQGATDYVTTLCGGVSGNVLTQNDSVSVNQTAHNAVNDNYGAVTCTVNRGANGTAGDGYPTKEWAVKGTTKITTFTATAGNTYKIAMDTGTDTGTCPNTTTKYVLCQNYKIEGKVYKSTDGRTWKNYNGGAILNLTGPGTGIGTTSNSSGYYKFDGLSLGNYTVTLDPASIPDYHVTSPASGNYTNITPSATGVDFYIQPTTPPPPPPAPSVSSDCAYTSISNNQVVVISWTNPLNFPVTWVDISPDQDGSFTNYYHKQVSPSGSTTMTAPPSEFGLFQGTGPATLSLDPGKTYYFRLFNGTVGPTTTLKVPFCLPTSSTLNISAYTQALGGDAITGNTYGISGLRQSDAATQGYSAKNTYNPILINPTLTTSKVATTLNYGNVDLNGIVFTSYASLNNSSLGTVLSNLNSINKDFLILYAHCHNTPSCVYNGKTFTQGQYYVYFNGAWGSTGYSEGQTYTSPGNTIEVKFLPPTPGAHASYSPRFSVSFFSSLGTRTWETYHYFAGWDGTTTTELGSYKTPQ